MKILIFVNTHSTVTTPVIVPKIENILYKVKNSLRFWDYNIMANGMFEETCIQAFY
jgi:hypothetical protein